MNIWEAKFLEKVAAAFACVSPVVYRGHVTEVCGPIIRAILGGTAIGDVVSIQCGPDSYRDTINACVLGFSGAATVLSPLGSTKGIVPGATVIRCGGPPQIAIDESLLGCVVNAQATVLERMNSLGQVSRIHSEFVSTDNAPPDTLVRSTISKVFETGIRAIDGFSPVGEGQRLAVFAEPGVGKSTLLGTICRSSSADITVVGLIGERAREVREFADSVFASTHQSKIIIVASTSAEPASQRIQAAMTATRIAEYFRDQGKSVLLQIDSLTRLFRAYREVGLAAGEIPVRRGYPPSVFSRLPELIERAGTAAVGSITALYTVLLSSDMDEDPMVEEVKGLTDGHILLSRIVAEQGQYPAVDIHTSISRLASRLLTPQTQTAIRVIKSTAFRLAEERELLLLGGNSYPEDAQRREFLGALRDFLTQDASQRCGLEETMSGIALLSEKALRVQN